MGEGAAQDRVRSALSAAHQQGAQAGVRAVCEGARREEEQADGKAAAGGVQAAWQVSRRWVSMGLVVKLT